MTNGAFGGGNGSAGSPFLVEDGADLLAINNNLAAHYKQTENIDLSAWSNWPGIGSYNDREFTGVYDGTSKVVTGMKIDFVKKYDDSYNYSQYAGFFNTCIGATVENLIMHDTIFYCEAGAWVDEIEAYLGVISSVAENSVFNNCIVDGLRVDLKQNEETQQNYDNVYIGGLLFAASECNVSSCHVKNVDFSVKIKSAYLELSGICVDIRAGIFSDCTVNGLELEVLGVRFPGDSYIEFNGFGRLSPANIYRSSVDNINYKTSAHLVGFSQEISIFGSMTNGSSSQRANGYLENCFAKGNVSLYNDDDYTEVSGFGYVDTRRGYANTLKNCYNVLNINGIHYTEAEVNTIARVKETTIVSVYTDKDVFAVPDDYWSSSFSEAHRTTAQMKTKDNYIGWDFENVWAIHEGVTYPFFRPKPTKSRTRCERINITKLLGGY